MADVPQLDALAEVLLLELAQHYILMSVADWYRLRHARLHPRSCVCSLHQISTERDQNQMHVWRYVGYLLIHDESECQICFDFRGRATALPHSGSQTGESQQANE